MALFVVPDVKKICPAKRTCFVAHVDGHVMRVGGIFGGLVLKTHREYQNFKARENRIEAKLIQARKEFAQKETYMARLIEDPEFLERVVRERLGYARPDELLFRFSDEP